MWFGCRDKWMAKPLRKSLCNEGWGRQGGGPDPLQEIHLKRDLFEKIFSFWWTLFKIQIPPLLIGKPFAGAMREAHHNALEH